MKTMPEGYRTEVPVSEDILRKFVVALVAVLAIFTFIRDYPGSSPQQGAGRQVEARAELIP